MAKKKSVKKIAKKKAASAKRVVKKTSKRTSGKTATAKSVKAKTPKKTVKSSRSTASQQKASATKKKVSKIKKGSAKASAPAKPAGTKKTAKKGASSPAPSSRRTRTSRQSAGNAPSSTSVPATTNLGGESTFTEAQLRKVKTDLTKKDLDRFRQLLLEKRAEIIGDVTAMQADMRHMGDDGDLSHVPMHMADAGSDNFEQEFTLGLVASERRLLHEVDEALLRIESGIYGVCLLRGVPIGKLRLEAKPWAKYCIEAARDLELKSRR